jgi:hypothetical protein
MAGAVWPAAAKSGAIAATAAVSTTSATTTGRKGAVGCQDSCHDKRGGRKGHDQQCGGGAPRFYEHIQHCHLHPVIRPNLICPNSRSQSGTPV